MRVDYAARARTFVGTPFRPQGRRRDGLDCVGLVIATYGISTDAVRRNYRLRGNHRIELEQTLGKHFRRVGSSETNPGDAMLMMVAIDQMHLAVKTDVGFVHAHAGLRRVVETPGEPQWPLVGVYRRRTRTRSS